MVRIGPPRAGGVTPPPPPPPPPRKTVVYKTTITVGGTELNIHGFIDSLTLGTNNAVLVSQLELIVPEGSKPGLDREYGYAVLRKAIDQIKPLLSADPAAGNPPEVSAAAGRAIDYLQPETVEAALEVLQKPVDHAKAEVTLILTDLNNNTLRIVDPAQVSELRAALAPLQTDPRFGAQVNPLLAKYPDPAAKARRTPPPPPAPTRPAVAEALTWYKKLGPKFLADTRQKLVTSQVEIDSRRQAIVDKQKEQGQLRKDLKPLSLLVEALRGQKAALEGAIALRSAQIKAEILYDTLEQGIETRMREDLASLERRFAASPISTAFASSKTILSSRREKDLAQLEAKLKEKIDQNQDISDWRQLIRLANDELATSEPPVLVLEQQIAQIDHDVAKLERELKGLEEGIGKLLQSASPTLDEVRANMAAVVSDFYMLMSELTRALPKRS